jgi:hypothetical protein
VQLECPAAILSPSRAPSRFRSLIAFGALTLASATAQAVDIRPTVKIGYEAGGDELVIATFTSGSTENVKAGTGVLGGIGVSLLNEAKSFEIETTIGVKADFINAKNGDVTWVRYPVDLLAFYRFWKLRVGGGITYHLNPKVTSSGAAAGVNQSYDAALGYVVQADFLFSGAEESKGAYLGVRFTGMDYDLKGGGYTAKANSVGVQFGYRF